MSEDALTCARPLVRLQGVPGVTPAYRAVLGVLAGVLAASVTVVAGHYELYAATNGDQKNRGQLGLGLCVCVLGRAVLISYSQLPIQYR